ncbi:deoxyribodipyrimidine photo-lyase [Moraxella sp. ZY210820]|uniref:cryptochrome/photolyase family protein n=1 Tax=unclassified Moraxella TaxID=2685852 RepID=UPI00272F3FB5|nr:FAD-binding domain-containing protein [Moraxella sp. ZY210820]WLF83309.1 deoxyribodipyrimidine photo-lyase [Moraxella sp. ZY210820]
MPNNTQPHYLMWFRRDLRTLDNTALLQCIEQAQQKNAQVSALFIATPQTWLQHDMSLIQLKFMLNTLLPLAEKLAQHQIYFDIKIVPSYNNVADILKQYCLEHHIQQIYFNYEYEEREIHRDDDVYQQLKSLNISCFAYHDQCILAPRTVLKDDGDDYCVFTPFYKKWLDILQKGYFIIKKLPKNRHNRCDEINAQIERIKNAVEKTINDYAQQSPQSHIDSPFLHQAGEQYALQHLSNFIDHHIHHYIIQRDIPSIVQGTSQLSPYLAIGAISPRVCYQMVMTAIQQQSYGHEAMFKWLNELCWRDFYRHILVARPDMIRHHAFQKAVDKQIDWRYNEQDFQRWCDGQTGVPIVDAGMRCLKQTGFLHNRVRMIVAMFLTKNLLIDWRWGERYFMQQLIDGDFASNNGGWQWSASVGTDAVPYFRIMNPFSQAKTHDVDAIFIKTWVPELVDIPAHILHDEKKLTVYLTANPHINYPLPIVDLKTSRAKAIDVFKQANEQAKMIIS